MYTALSNLIFNILRKLHRENTRNKTASHYLKCLFKDCAQSTLQEYISIGQIMLWRSFMHTNETQNTSDRITRTYFTSSRPSGPTKYSTNHWQASMLLESSASMVAIHSSVSALQQNRDNHQSSRRKKHLPKQNHVSCLPYLSFFLVRR